MTLIQIPYQNNKAARGANSAAQKQGIAMHQNDKEIITQAPDFSEALRFLAILDKNPDQFTFETIEEPKPVKGSAKIQRYVGAFSEHKNSLLDANMNGSGVFCTVNATDGKGRKKENIVRVRAVFVDLDGSPLDTVKKGPLPPHIVVESSPGRYHAYWIIVDMPLKLFEKVQRLLAERFGGDPAVCDLPRLMRLPGFLHMKREPFRSHIIESCDTKPYTFEAFQKAFGLTSRLNEENGTSSNSSGVLELASTTLSKLRELGLIKRFEDHVEGRWLILCPWANEHTSGGEDAHYFVKSSKGYPGEGFKCFHSHCNGRDIRSLRFFLGLTPIEGLDPLPLFREVPPSSPFPVRALGPILEPAANEMYTTIKAPLAVIAQSLLGAASLVTQGHANIGIHGRVIALSLFLITVAESGERKSAVDDAALSAILEWQRQLWQVYREDLRKYRISLQEFQDAKKKHKKDCEDVDDMKDKTEPRPPIQPIILIEEPTYEGLVKYLEDGQPSVGLFSDEGGRFLGGNAMSRDNVLKTLAGLSSFWDAKPGKPITRIRSVDKSLALYGRRVALHLMIQESVYSQLNQQSMCESQGFLPRCLISFPESMAGRRSYVMADISRAPAIVRFKQCCNNLLDRVFPTAPLPAPQNELEPPTITLSEDATSLWVQFYESIEAELGAGHRFHSIRRFGSKAPEHVLRVAGVLSVFEDPATRRIEAEYVARAIAIINYYLCERLRLEDYYSIEPALLNAQKVLDWASAKEKPGVILKELYQFGPPNVRSKDKALAILKVLESHGRAFPIPAHELKQDAKGKAWRFIWPCDS